MSITELHAAAERRRDRRYALPALEIVIGNQSFRALDWSLTGALIYGLCELAGMRLRGEIGVPGSSEAMPFTATVLRTDIENGNSVICFEDFRTERIDFTEQLGAAQLQ